MGVINAEQNKIHIRKFICENNLKNSAFLQKK